MNWSNEPATEQQLSYLQQCGSTVDYPLTRSEAAQLIKKGREQSASEPVGRTGRKEAYHLGMVLEEQRSTCAHAGSAVVELCLSPAVEKRREFWLDTCREMTEMRSAAPQAFELYQKHGCRFVVPTREEVQTVLDALDNAVSSWEQSYPELFYQTLELNFPELVKHHL